MAGGSRPFTPCTPSTAQAAPLDSAAYVFWARGAWRKSFCNSSPPHGFLEATATVIMKTLISTLSILALTMTAVSLDAYPLDGSAWLTAAIVATLFGFAFNDSPRTVGLAPRER